LFATQISEMFIKIPKEKIEGHFHGEEGRRTHTIA
jgi:hypothetical protein